VKNFDTRVYSVADFLEWNESGLLNLSPDFQRRAVWTEKGKSYLIDTLLRGKPIPKLILTQELKGGRNLRIVVDGQQRLRSIIEYVSGHFKISRAHNPEYAGLFFDDLRDDARNDFLKYELGVDLLFDPEYEDLLDIFARINIYTVTLNKQEKFNARYLGFFKQYVFSYGYKYVNYFLASSVLTRARVTRMAEAELSADLFIALLDEVQTNKNVDVFYKQYEDTADGLPEVADKFDTIMSFIGDIYSAADLANTNWSRIHLFYTLFTSLGHFLYGIGGLSPELRVPIRKSHIGRLRVALDEISANFDQYGSAADNDSIPSDYRTFINQARRGTTDTSARIGRSTFVCKKLAEALR
jgi:hypothetical protein